MGESRERWAHRPAFLMAAIGSAIGLGNVWRFPGIAFQNGGGAFFIPWLVAILTAGIPLMILEFGIGTRMQGSAPLAFRRLHPKAEFLGWWAVLVGLGICIYYCVIIAWSWDYTWKCVQSLFTGSLAWERGQAGVYFDESVTRKSPSWSDPGGLNLRTLIGLTLTWIAIWFCVGKDVKRVGKVVMITVPLPLILLLVLAVRGLTLDGAMDGVAYYLAPDWNKLADPTAWLAAYSQVFFSLSVGWGILIAYASYVPRESDTVNNAYITSFANCGFSFLAGFAVFSTLGYLGLAMNRPIADLRTTTFGLTFLSYPTAIENFPGGVFSQALLGGCFFLMLLTLGIDSAFSIVEAVACAVQDKFGLRRERLVLLLCVLGFAGGLFFCLDWGIHWLDLVDKFIIDYGLTLGALAQCVFVAWVLPRQRLKELQEEIDRRSEMRAGAFWRICLRFVTPVVLLAAVALATAGLIQGGYEGYDATALWLGMIPAAVALLLALLLQKVPWSERSQTPLDAGAADPKAAMEG